MVRGGRPRLRRTGRGRTRSSVAPRDPFETLRRFIVHFVEATAGRPALLRIVNQEATHGPGRGSTTCSTRYIGPTSLAVEQALE